MDEYADMNSVARGHVCMLRVRGRDEVMTTDNDIGRVRRGGKCSYILMNMIRVMSDFY